MFSNYINIQGVYRMAQSCVAEWSKGGYPTQLDLCIYG